MAEPNSMILGGATLGVMLSSILLFLGVQPDALVVGLFAATLVSIQMETVNRPWKAAAVVILAGMAAGYGSPVVASVALSKLSVGTELLNGLRLLAALIIGASTPGAVPLISRVAPELLKRWLEKRLERKDRDD